MADLLFARFMPGIGSATIPTSTPQYSRSAFLSGRSSRFHGTWTRKVHTERKKHLAYERPALVAPR